MADQALRSFLTKLSKDPKFRTEFSENRLAVMDKAGLNDKEKVALLSGNAKVIQTELGDGGGDLLHVDAEIIIKLHIT